eukprot:m.287566 g.287566  ORF g.287566 m.287566 type:complete len:482 (-) comp19445_c0_seq4:45-1490(-)
MGCCGGDGEELTVGFVGINGAGKTTAIMALCKEDVDDVTETVGFSQHECRFKGNELTLYDVGGGPRIRDIWSHYYAEMHGLVFVVDASDADHVAESATVLEQVVKHPYVAGKPVLILANKQDQPNSLKNTDISKELNLALLVALPKSCDFSVHECNVKRRKGVIDRELHTGMKWLTYTIHSRRQALDPRIEADMAEQRAREKEERRAKQKRVQLERDAREAAANAVQPVDASDDGREKQEATVGQIRRRTDDEPEVSDVITPQRPTGKRKRLDATPATVAKPAAAVINPLSGAIEPTTDAVAVKVLVGLAVCADATPDIDRNSFEFLTWRRCVRDAWHELKKQLAGGRRLSVERIARKGYGGWCAATQKTWDAETYGAPPPRIAKLPDGGLADSNFTDEGLDEYHARCQRAGRAFETIGPAERLKFYLMAEVLTEQFERTYPAAKALPLRKRDKAAHSCMVTHGLPTVPGADERHRSSSEA